MAFLNYSYPDINAIPAVHERYLELIRSGDWKAARDDMERTITEFGEELAEVYEHRLTNDSRSAGPHRGVAGSMAPRCEVADEGE